MIPGVEQSLNILLPSIWWLSASGVCECGISSKHYSSYIFAPKPRKTPRLSGSCSHNYLCKFTGIFVSAETNFHKFLPCCCKTFRKKVPKLWPQVKSQDFIRESSWTSKEQSSIPAETIASKRLEPAKRNVFKSWKAEVLWAVRTNERKCILVDDWFGPEGSKIYDSLEFGFESRM